MLYGQTFHYIIQIVYDIVCNILKLQTPEKDNKHFYYLLLTTYYSPTTRCFL